MHRRSYLRALSLGIAGVAGCSDVIGTEQMPVSPSTVTPDEVNVRIETLTMRVDVPWGIDFHPESTNLYFTERPGQIRRLERGEEGGLSGGRREVVADFTDTVVSSEDGDSGLLGFVFHPNDPSVAYTYQTYRGDDGLRNRVVRHDVNDGFTPTGVLLDGIPAAKLRNGGRLAIGPERALYVTTGDAMKPDAAQNLESLAGKVLRLTLDGAPHPENPFGNATFTYGHCNPQGIAFHPSTGVPFCTDRGDEHGAVSVLRPGHNYGWPSVQNDRGKAADSIVTYNSAVQPGGAAFYTGDIEEWRGDLFFGALAGRHLHRIVVDPETTTVARENILLQGEYGRLRTAFTGPNDGLFVTTSNRDEAGAPIPQDDRILQIRPV